jgi:hypothetical protein
MVFLRAKKCISFSLLLSTVLLCQMFGWPDTAISAERKAMPDANLVAERGRVGHLESTAFPGEATSENPALLAVSDFYGCDPSFRSFDDHANNYLQPDPVDGNRCVAGIGANHATYGKLMTHQFSLSRDVWMSGYVYFPVGFILPAVTSGPNGVCNGGIHLWRLHETLTSNRLSMDFNVPAGLDVIQFYVFRDNGSTSFVKNTAYNPAKLKGQWQYWQIHVNLGTPGKNDGFLRFYADGHLVDSMEKQPFLPVNADASWGFSYADMQSNIGGCNLQWPVQNSWLVSDVRVCKDSVC